MTHVFFSRTKSYFLSYSNEKTWRLFCMTIAISLRNVVEKAMVLSALSMIWIYCWMVFQGKLREAGTRWSSGKGLWRKGFLTKIWPCGTISISTSGCWTWSTKKPTKSPTLSKKSSTSCMNFNEIRYWFLCICTITTWLKLMQSAQQPCPESCISVVPGGTQETIRILSCTPVLTFTQSWRRERTWCGHTRNLTCIFFKWVGSNTS